MRKNKKALSENMKSWKQLFHFYKQVKIPWFMLVLVLLMSLAIKETESMLVPYTSKIMTGAITETGFLGAFVLMTLLYGFTEAVQGGVGELAAQMTTRNVRHSVWGKLLRLPMSFYENRDSQTLVSRVTQDTTGAYAAIAVLVQLISLIYGIYTNFVKMYATYKSLALIMLTGIPITMLCAWVTGKMQYKVNEITNSSLSAITNFFAERLPNILRIKTASMEDEEYKKGVAANEARYKAEIRQEKWFIFIAPIGSFAQYLNEIVLLLVAAAMVRAGSMKMFQLVNLYNYYLLFMANAYMLSAVWQMLKGAQGSCATIAAIADLPDEDMTSGQPLPKAVGHLTAEDISFAYEDREPVLNHVSFTIPEGKITAVVGENGCGKSTLIKLLEQFHAQQEGSLCLNGQPLSDIRLEDWRERVGYLFQGNQIIKGTIRENIAYGVHREFTQEELEDAARQALAYDFIVAKEQGFDTEISRFDTRCSGGEMQRIAIARVILKQPDILIMDEATSGIDIISEHEVMEALMHVMEGKTVIMVSHDMELIRRADNVIVLNQGQVEASGNFEKVAATSPLLQDFIAKGGIA